AQRLKRVFGIDVTTCVHCGGAVRIVASIEEPTAIRAILAHFEKHGAREEAHYRPAARAPPGGAARPPAGHDAEGENWKTPRRGHDPAGPRSAPRRGPVRNGYALSRCVAPRCRKPTHEPPICARSVPKAALARPLPTRQTRQKGRLNFLYPHGTTQSFL